MILFDLLIAVSVGVFLTVVFSFIFKRTGPWDNTFLFFIITFLGTWAIGLWLKPIGPSFYGYYWIIKNENANPDDVSAYYLEYAKISLNIYG